MTSREAASADRGASRRRSTAHGHDNPAAQGQPAVSRRALLTVRRTWRDGDRPRERYAVLAARGDGFVVRRYVREAGTPWRRAGDATAWPEGDLGTLVEGRPELHTVPAGAISEYTVTSEALAVNDLVLRLRAPLSDEEPAEPTGRSEGDAWPADLVSAWREHDDRLRRGLTDLQTTSRWVSVNGSRLAAIRNGSPDAPRLTLALADESHSEDEDGHHDEDEGEYIGAAEDGPVWTDDPDGLADRAPRLTLRSLQAVASGQWESDVPGLGLSGGSQLEHLGFGLLRLRAWGDEEDDEQLIPCVADALADVVAQWIEDRDYVVHAAATLEPPWPDDGWSDQQRQRRRRQLAAIDRKFALNLDPPTLDLLRQRLRAISPRYGLACHALREVDSDEGRALADELDTYERTGQLHVDF